MTDSVKINECNSKKKNRGQIICSTITSITKVLIVQPFDFLRYRIQTSFKSHYNLSTVVKRMTSLEGLNIFLKAVTVTATGIYIATFSFFFFYQKGKDFLLKFKYYKDDPFCNQGDFKLTKNHFENCEETRELYKSKLFKVASFNSSSLEYLLHY